jgi:hypothetical protein
MPKSPRTVLLKKARNEEKIEKLKAERTEQYLMVRH